MDSLFGAIIWLVIISFWVTSLFKKSKKEVPRGKAKDFSDFEKKILEVFGVPSYEIPQPEAGELPLPEEQEKKYQPDKKKELQGEPSFSAKAKEKVKQAQAAPLAEDFLSEAKLGEGIVLSVILGPPKAYRFFGPPPIG